MQVSVGFIKWVPVDAVRLARVMGRDCVTTKDVLAVSDGLDMGWVHTSAGTAEMIGLKSEGDGAD